MDALVDHHLSGCPGHQKLPEEVYIHHRVEILHRGVHRILMDTDARVVEHHMHRPEAFQNLREGGVDAGLVGDVGSNPAALFPGGGDPLQGAFGLAAAEDDHPGPRLGQADGGSLADPLAGAGDHRHLTL